MKKQNGITLISLIITIIVMLILAGVAISMVMGDGAVVEQAIHAQESFEEAATEETEKIEELNKTIQKKTIKGDSLSGKVAIGDYVAYDATNNYSYESVVGKGSSHGNGYAKQTFTSNSDIKWRVFDIDTVTGEIVLISENPLQTDAGANFYLKGGVGYLYAEEELNRICSIYGHGFGADTSKTFNIETGDTFEGLKTVSLTDSGARSLNVDDINKIMNYQPQAGTEKTHTIYYPSTKTLTTTAKSTSAKSRTDVYTHYSYLGSKYLATTDEMYKLLFRNPENTANISFWLGSRSLYFYNRGDYFCERYVKDAKIDSFIIADGYESSLYAYEGAYGIRPIVYLKADALTTGKDESGAWTLLNLE